MQSIINNKRSYQLVGPINVESTQKLLAWWQERLDQDGSDQWLQLCINSSGGATLMGFGIIDFAMSIQKMHIQTIGLGEVSSMAIPLFLIGEKRVVSPYATFFFHEGGYTFNKDTRYATSEFRKELQSLELQEKLYVEFIVSRTAGKVSTDTILKMMREETRLRAKEVLELGLAHEISEYGST